MNKFIAGFALLAVFVPAATHAYVDCRESTGCTVAQLIEISNQSFLTTQDRVSALMQAVQMLVAQIAQIKSTAPAAPSSSCFVPVNDLYIGKTDAQTNGEVSKLQQFLLDQGYGDPDGDSGFLLAKPTGYYGEKTATAVVKWQKAHGMDFVTLTSGVGKQTRAKMQEACSKPIAQCGKYNDPSAISSISPASGPVGTKITLQGCNFSGFEGDKIVWFENSSGVKGVYNAQSIDGKLDSSNASAQITLPPRLCRQDNGYSGLPCTSYLDLTPGVYSIHAVGWGGTSNSVNFTVTQ